MSCSFFWGSGPDSRQPTWESHVKSDISQAPQANQFPKSVFYFPIKPCPHAFILMPKSWESSWTSSSPSTPSQSPQVSLSQSSSIVSTAATFLWYNRGLLIISQLSFLFTSYSTLWPRPTQQSDWASEKRPGHISPDRNPLMTFDPSLDKVQIPYA